VQKNLTLPCLILEFLPFAHFFILTCVQILLGERQPVQPVLVNQVSTQKWLLEVCQRASLIDFFCAQILLHFSRDFEQTFVEALSSSALDHMLGVL
jgi:hypothetical protein